MPRRLCHYCRQPMKKGGKNHPRSATWDHKVPKSRGGGGGDNKVRACRTCNTDKADRTEAEYREVLAQRTAAKRQARGQTP